jgi:hypothetical protein
LGEGAQALGPEGMAAARARGTGSGKTLAEAKASLPKAIEQAGNITAQLQSLENDDYLNTMLGNVQGRMPNFSADAERVQSKMDQVTGSAFLQAFQMLKGGGQITNVEGEKATAAITRLQNVRQDEQAYREAINELKLIARNSVIRAQIDAGARPPEDINLLYDFESLGLGAVNPPAQNVEVGIPASGPEYREPVQTQGVNPRAPGYQAGAGVPQEPNRFNPRAPNYQPGKVLDAGGGFQVKVK